MHNRKKNYLLRLPHRQANLQYASRSNGSKVLAFLVRVQAYGAGVYGTVGAVGK